MSLSDWLGLCGAVRGYSLWGEEPIIVVEEGGSGVSLEGGVESAELRGMALLLL